MTELKWFKSGNKWIGIHGRFRAEVKAPDPDWGGLRMYHWSVRTANKNGGSGGTSSAASAKREAEREVERFKAFLRKQA